MVILDVTEYGQNINSVVTDAAAQNTSYAATYWPWIQTVDPNTAQRVWVPASTMIPGVYAFNDNSTEAWYAPAGTSRGVISNAIRAERFLTQGNRDTLYEANINPIATFPNSGVTVFGQKTLQKKASALDRVNVRRLLIELKNYISQIAEGDNTQAIGDYSHAEGYSTIASGSYQHVSGQFNTHGDTTSLFIVGNGVDDATRKDAFKVRQSGSIILPTTVSSTPGWTGTPGEMIFGDDGGGTYTIYVWLDGAWRSGSLV